MGSKRNAHTSNSFYSNNNSTRQTSSTNGNTNTNGSVNSSSNNNNVSYQNNDGGSNSSSHSLKHNSTKDKISRRSSKKMLSIVFDSINNSSSSDNVTKTNLSSFNNSVLRKYKDTYKIKTKSNYTREDLLNAVTKHWNSQELSEKDIITQFIYTVRNHGNLLRLPLNLTTKNQTPKSKSTNTN